MRILIKKTQEGWKIRFPHNNPWKMPAGEWLADPSGFTKEAPAHLITAFLIANFPGCNVFAVIPIGEDLGQTDD